MELARLFILSSSIGLGTGNPGNLHFSELYPLAAYQDDILYVNLMQLLWLLCGQSGADLRKSSPSVSSHSAATPRDTAPQTSFRSLALCPILSVCIARTYHRSTNCPYLHCPNYKNPGLAASPTPALQRRRYLCPRFSATTSPPSSDFESFSLSCPLTPFSALASLV